MTSITENSSIYDNEDLILPPDPARVIQGLRDTGYNFCTSIADLVDNSIAAEATKINIKISMDPLNNITVYIADNGHGMDFDGLKNAMKYGSDVRVDPSSLGKFGLGLKTASTAFCRCLSLLSKSKNSNGYFKVRWDLDYISSENRWHLLVPQPTSEEISILEETTGGVSGTLVIWEKIDRMIKSYGRAGNARNALKKITEELEFHLSLVYQRFLDFADDREKSITIQVNEHPIKAWDPFCIPESELLAKDEIDVEMQHGETPTFQLRAFVLPRKEEFSTTEKAVEAKISNDMQGFYIYRENRLIHYGDWMGMFSNEPHGSLLRVELSFNHQLDEAFQVDIKKSRILLNEEIFIYIRDNFISGPRREADLLYRKGQIKTAAAAGEDAHAASNRSIETKAKGIEEAEVIIQPGKTEEATVSNSQGTFFHKISIRESTKPGQTRVIPIGTLEAGMLWEPCIVDGQHAVYINQSHPYYQKVYYPVIEEPVMVTGMDSLLWALAEAELSTFNNETAEQYEDMRIKVSRFLKKLLIDLPEPPVSEEVI